MICETCEHLQTADGDPEKPPFFCEKNKRNIKDPKVEQKWCNQNDRKKEHTKALYMIQTTEREIQFINRLTVKQLSGYIEATCLRDDSKTDFDIPIVLTHARERLKKLVKVPVKSV